MREKGYYWCRDEDGWDIFEWIFECFSKEWCWDMKYSHNGEQIHEDDDYFDEIDEKQIKKE